MSWKVLLWARGIKSYLKPVHPLSNAVYCEEVAIICKAFKDFAVCCVNRCTLSCLPTFSKIATAKFCFRCRRSREILQYLTYCSAHTESYTQGNNYNYITRAFVFSKIFMGVWSKLLLTWEKTFILPNA